MDGDIWGAERRPVDQCVHRRSSFRFMVGRGLLPSLTFKKIKRVIFYNIFLVSSFSGYSIASDYGTTGLIDIPTARMAEDATFTYTTAYQDRTTAVALSYQALPWLETTFRYRRENNVDQYDRNFEAKIRLLEESYWFPQVAVGMRDLVGTGRLRAEYFVMSKYFYGFDLSLGLGWGSLAGNDKHKNPLKYLSNSFSSRDDDFEQAGKIPTDTMFRGDNVSIFWGASYQLKTLPLKFVAERNPDQYPEQVDRGDTPPESTLSFGLEWTVTPGMVLGLSRQHGEDWGVNLALQTDTLQKPPKRLGNVYDSSIESPQWNENEWYRNLLYDMERDGLYLLEGAIDDLGTTAYLVIGNKDYPLWADAVSQATALADLHLPPRVEVIHFTLEEDGYRMTNLKVKRPSSLLAQQEYDELELYPSLIAPEETVTPDYKTDFVKKKVAFDIGLSTRLQLFDPDAPVRYQFAATLGTLVPLPKKFLLRAAYRFNINQNFEESTRQSDSVLPHVRSDIVRYLEEGESGLDALYLERRGKLSNNFYYRSFGGVLEEMFSGVGGEVLYHPFKSRVGIGASLSWVKQRDYDKGFEHLDYETVTGFVSAYWASPFHNYDVAIHTGKYLAKDVGMTLEVRRTFDNGWMVGAWATLTDVSSEEFGEGSFDKGIFLRIPLDGVFEKNTRSAYQTTIRPVQRDGGQRLDGFSGTIWFDQRDARFDAISSNKERVKSW